MAGKKKYDCPYSETYTDFKAYLAENNGQIAFAIAPKYIIKQYAKEQGDSQIWFSKGDSLEPIKIYKPLPDANGNK